MPSRIIRDSARFSRTLWALSAEAERLFWRLTLVADDWGRFDADPRVLLAQCFPLGVEELRVMQVATWFEELQGVDLVRCYEANGQTYGIFLTWGKHQRTRAGTSRFPEPPAVASSPAEESRGTLREIPASSGNLPETAGNSRSPAHGRPRMATRESIPVVSSGLASSVVASQSVGISKVVGQASTVRTGTGRNAPKDLRSAQEEAPAAAGGMTCSGLIAWWNTAIVPLGGVPFEEANGSSKGVQALIAQALAVQPGRDYWEVEMTAAFNASRVLQGKAPTARGRPWHPDLLWFLGPNNNAKTRGVENYILAGMGKFVDRRGQAGARGVEVSAEEAADVAAWKRRMQQGGGDALSDGQGVAHAGGG